MAITVPDGYRARIERPSLACLYVCVVCGKKQPSNGPHPVGWRPTRAANASGRDYVVYLCTTDRERLNG